MVDTAFTQTHTMTESQFNTLSLTAEKTFLKMKGALAGTIFREGYSNDDLAKQAFEAATAFHKIAYQFKRNNSTPSKSFESGNVFKGEVKERSFVFDQNGDKVYIVN